MKDAPRQHNQTYSSITPKEDKWFIVYVMDVCCFKLQTLCAEADPPCSSVEAQSFA